MIVVDVILVVYLLTDCPQRERAKKLYEQDPEWRMPDLWRHEFLNVIITLTRNRNVVEDDAVQLWRNGLALFGPLEHAPDQELAIKIAIDHGISGYDAQYVATAAELGTRLFTEDRRVRRKLPDLCRGLS